MGLEERQQTREIDGFTYQVTPLPFGVGQKALMRTIKVLSPILAAAFRNGANTKDPAFLGGLFEAIPTAITEDDLTWFEKVFGDTTFLIQDGKTVPLLKDAQEFHFAGRYLALFKWLIFCLEVNFAGFFTGMQKGANVGDLLRTVTGEAKAV